MIRKEAFGNRMLCSMLLLAVITVTCLNSGCSKIRNSRAPGIAALFHHQPAGISNERPLLASRRGAPGLTGNRGPILPVLSQPTSSGLAAGPSLGQVTVGGIGIPPQDIEIPQPGMTLGLALKSLRHPDTMQLRLPSNGETSEFDLVVRLVQGATTIYQPLFVAENTEARLTPLNNGDRVTMLTWEQTPLLANKLDEFSRFSSEDLKEKIGSQTATLEQGETAVAEASVANRPGIENTLAEQKQILKKLQTELELRKQTTTRITITLTGLVANRGTKNINIETDPQDINSIIGSMSGPAGAGGQSANVIVLNRKSDNRTDQYVLPFGEVINGEKIPFDLIQKITAIRNEARILNGDVFQFNQLQFLPTVLAGRMAQQMRMQVTAAQPRPQVGGLIPARYDQESGKIQREPSAIATGLRQFRLRLPQLPPPAFRLPRP